MSTWKNKRIGSSTCLGCNGIPWAQVDICNVCDGDNSTCTSTSGEVTPEPKTFDTNILIYSIVPVVAFVLLVIIVVVVIVKVRKGKNGSSNPDSKEHEQVPMTSYISIEKANASPYTPIAH